MSIKWNKVTWYSKVAAIVLFVGVFALAFYLGREYEEAVSTAVSTQNIAK